MAYRAIRWNHLSLRNKLTVVIVLLLTFGLVIAGIGTTLLLRPSLVGQLDEQLQGAAKNPSLLLGGNEATQTFTYDRVRTAPQPYYVALIKDDGDVLVHNLSGAPSARVPDLAPIAGLGTAPHAPGTPYPVANVRDELGTTWRAVVVPEEEHDSTLAQGILVIALPTSTVDATMASFLLIFFGFGLTVVIFAAALTRVLVSATLQPLREVEATAISFAAGDYGRRLSGATPNTEVGRLARSLNTMLGRIDEALDQRNQTIEQMRRFVGDASHELRTPLVTVRGYAELYRMGALDEPEKVAQAMDRVEKEALRMGGLVEDLLQLARLDETRELVKTVVDLEPIAEDAAMDATAQAPDRRIRAVGVRVVEPDPDDDASAEALADAADEGHAAPSAPSAPTGAEADGSPDEGSADAVPRRRRWLPQGRNATLPLPDVRRMLRRRSAEGVEGAAVDGAGDGEAAGDHDLPPMILGNEDKVRQAVSNIIGNALRYTPEGSPLEIGVVVDPARDEAVVEVIDHGEGIPEPIRQKIFQRFWRADTSRDRATGGSGLGLAIVSAIMRAHAGGVDVVETPGGGATFRLVFPLLRAEDVDEPLSTGPAHDPGDDETYS